MQTVKESIESEQSVLGALLIDNNAIDRIPDLSVEHFYNFEHRTIFLEICKQITSGQRADVITVGNAIKSSMQDAMPYLLKIEQNTPSSVGIVRYASIVKDKAIKRALASICDEGIEISTRHEESGVLVDLVASKIELLSRNRIDKEPKRFSDMLMGYTKTIDDRLTGLIKPIATGYRDLDYRLGGGLERGTLTVIAGRPASGKELTLYSKVLLSNGKFKLMGDIKMNDKVASIDGVKSFVTGIFPQGIKPVYRITFSDGRTVDAGLDHQWEINFRQWNKPRVLTTQQLIEKLKAKRYNKRLSIPYTNGDFGKDENLLINPYLLGVLLGDGSFANKSIRLTTSYSHIVNKISTMLLGCELKQKDEIEYSLVTPRGKENKLLDAIKSFKLNGKLSHEKFIPEQYLSASKKSRIDLLMGLIDTDGTVEKGGSMAYTTTSEVMAHQIQSLCRSLGSYARLTSRITKYPYLGEIKEGKRSYTISIVNPNYANFVSIPHKSKNIIKSKKFNRLLNIESIDYLGDFECQCISVSHNRSLYLTDEYTVTHNTALGLGIARNISNWGSALFLSMEMSDTQVVDRNISALGKVDIQFLRNPAKCNPESENYNWAAIQDGFAKAQDMNLFIDDQTGLNMLQIRAKSRKVKRQHGLDVIVIDQLSFITGAQSKNQWEYIGEFTRATIQLAKELDVPVVLLAQLNRDCEKRQDKRPILADLASSGSIEQDAANVIMLYRDEIYNPDSMDKGKAEIHVVKQRQGSPGMVGLAYIGEQTRFEDLANPWEPRKEEHKRRSNADNI